MMMDPTSPYGNYTIKRCKREAGNKEREATFRNSQGTSISQPSPPRIGDILFHERMPECLGSVVASPSSNSRGVIPAGGKGEHVDIKYIKSQELADIIQRKNTLGVQVIIVDCRYPYEYEGGHIEGSINLFSNQMIHDAFVSTLEHAESQSLEAYKDLMIVFHCEFSSVRGPAGYRYLREHDRRANYVNYPRLCYPNLFLLEDGYKKFYPHYQHLCSGGYVEMFDKNHAEDLKMCRRAQKAQRQLRKRSLFGDNNDDEENSEDIRRR